MSIEKLAEKFDTLSVEEVIEKLGEVVETRQALRAYLVKCLRQNGKLFEGEIPFSERHSEEGNVRRKLNRYPGEIGDVRLIKFAKAFLLKENENYFAEKKLADVARRAKRAERRGL